MSAYLLAIIANVFWATVNVVDKYLIDRFCTNGSVGSLLVLSSLFPVFLLPLAYILSADSLFIHLSQSLILVVSGVLTTAWIYFYMKALLDDGVVTVVPILQLSPVFSLILGMLVLNEFPTSQQLFAGLFIIIGSLILSFERSTNKVKIKLLLYVSAAAVIIALMNVLFKFVAIEVDFWTSIFWHSTGTVLTGCLLLMFNKVYRKSFIDFIKTNWGVGIGLNSLNESLTITGDVIFAYSILLAPLALVHTMEGFQPLFVLLISSLLVKLNLPYFRDYVDEHNVPKLQLILGFAFITIGGVFLAFTSI